MLRRPPVDRWNTGSERAARIILTLISWQVWWRWPWETTTTMKMNWATSTNHDTISRYIIDFSLDWLWLLAVGTIPSSVCLSVCLSVTTTKMNWATSTDRDTISRYITQWLSLDWWLWLLAVGTTLLSVCLYVCLSVCLWRCAFGPLRIGVGGWKLFCPVSWRPWRALPVHFFRPFCCRMYHLVTNCEKTDGHQKQTMCCMLRC